MGFDSFRGFGGFRGFCGFGGFDGFRGFGGFRGFCGFGVIFMVLGVRVFKTFVVFSGSVTWNDFPIYNLLCASVSLFFDSVSV